MFKGDNGVGRDSRARAVDARLMFLITDIIK